MNLNECDFCGAKSWVGPPYPEGFHDIFHLTGWPCVLCTRCMDEHFGPTEQEALLGLIHDRLVAYLSDEEE